MGGKQVGGVIGQGIGQVGKCSAQQKYGIRKDGVRFQGRWGKYRMEWGQQVGRTGGGRQEEKAGLIGESYISPNFETMFPKEIMWRKCCKETEPNFSLYQSGLVHSPEISQEYYCQIFLKWKKNGLSFRKHFQNFLKKICNLTSQQPPKLNFI